MVVEDLRTGEERELANDFVFALTGYHADDDFLQAAGVAIDPESRRPAIDPETNESNVPGLYLAGVVQAGKETGKIFIENGRFHGQQIFAHLRRHLS